jgi:hypothetical protein
MAKVTIVLEDTERGFTIHADFDQPGVPFEEMQANPTPSVAAGLIAVRILAAMAGEVEGGGSDDDGSPLSLAQLLDLEG